MPDPQIAPVSTPNRPALLLVLAVIVGLEALLVTGAAVWLLVELLTVRPASYPSAVAITVLAFLAAAWAIATTVGLARRRGWARASALSIQILQLAVAVGCFQGLFARPDLGWALLVPAVVAGVLAVAPPVVRATSRAADPRNTEQHE
ncbi:hypothetical protein [Leifsonia xyli]|uniref:hypothetical protein n=1 Tax=Leifsonia xyli TaxID=1575 RepID=UPI003D672A66